MEGTSSEREYDAGTAGGRTRIRAGECGARLRRTLLLRSWSSCASVQEWLPQYMQLTEGTPEKVVAGSNLFGWTYNIVYIGMHPGFYDAHVYDAFGGFAEFQRVWRGCVHHLRTSPAA